MKKVLIVILVILVFIFGSYFMYKEVWPRLDKRITVIEEFNVKKDEDEKEEKIDLVSDAYSYNGKYKIQTTCAGEMEVTVDIKLPKINIDKPNALKLNETILNDFSDYTKYDENSGISGETKIEYKYSGWNNYLFIYIDGGITHRCSGGITVNNIYYYDIENDKILNAEEIFNAAGLPQEEWYKSTKTQYPSFSQEDLEKYSTFEWCDENKSGCGCGLKYENGSFEIFNISICG